MRKSLARKVRVAAACMALLATGCRTPGTAPANAGSALNEAGDDRLTTCTGSFRFAGPGPEAFDFSARELDWRNAYWMAILSADVYAKKEVVLPHLASLGFTDAQFFDEDDVSRNFLFSGIDFPWASTQGFWAETPEGVVLSFRGSYPSELADIVSDIWSGQGHLEGIGSEVIGTIGEVVAAAEGSLPGGSIQFKKGDEIYAHRGFWNALQIVWKHVEARAKVIQIADRPGEIERKMARLDAWAEMLANEGEAAALAAITKHTDWRAPPEGKLKLLKEWAKVPDQPTRRMQLFTVIDTAMVSEQRPIFLTGHSLGGALATLAAYRLMQMGLNVRGLYTFGAPRAGNQAFTHDFRMLAYQKGLKTKGSAQASGNGGMQRFVYHLDVVARVPPALGVLPATFGASDNPELNSRWAHTSPFVYLGEPVAKVPSFVAELPLEGWKSWIGDHATGRYVQSIEERAFGRATSCNP